MKLPFLYEKQLNNFILFLYKNNLFDLFVKYLILSALFADKDDEIICHPYNIVKLKSRVQPKTPNTCKKSVTHYFL